MIQAAILLALVAQAGADMSMTAALKVLEQTPGAVAILVTVSLFIRHLSQEAKSTREFFREIHAEHIDQRELTRQAMERLSAATTENISATKQNTTTLSVLGKSVDMLLTQGTLQHRHHQHKE